jgi:uncharacterized protein YlxW (UPF0749 family)
VSIPNGEGTAARASERRFAPDFLTETFRNPLDAGYAEAAVRRTRRDPDAPRRLMAGRIARTVVLIATGFLLMVAYQQTAKGQPDSSRTRAGLVTDVKNLQVETDQLQKQADQLRDQVSKERDAALAAAGADASQLSRLELATGVTKVHGGGAVVKLADAPAPVDPVTGKPTGKNDGQIFDRDLQQVANELWHDGAEAIAINGERLTATSTIRTAGSTILVDFRPIVSPYEVTAIGPGDLDRRFSDSQTGRLFRAFATNYGMKVSTRAQGDLTLPAAADPQLHYAQPVPSTEPTPSHHAVPGRSGSPTPSASGGR